MAASMGVVFSMPEQWHCLESIPGLVALPAAWRALTGPSFDAFNALCLQESEMLALAVRCPKQPLCTHVVVHHPDGSIQGVCRQNRLTCPHIQLTRAEITPLELSWSMLARALCKAFGLQSKFMKFDLPSTVQIGAWSADSIPAILTIQNDRFIFRSVIGDLVASLNQPFILFAPTGRLLDAHGQQLLARPGAQFFPLDSNVIITEYGTLQPKILPGELFAKFTPQPREIDQDLATRVFALLNQFDPETLAVFRHYCIGALSPAQIARKCGCSRATVYRRLELIQQKAGVSPNQLRTLSPHLEKLEAQISDPRASRIHRTRLIYDDPDSSGD